MKTETTKTTISEALMPSTTSHLPPAADVAVQSSAGPYTGLNDYAVAPLAPAGDLPDTKIGTDEDGKKVTYLGELGKSLLNTFLGKHKDEWSQLQADEREKAQCAAQFRFYTDTLAATKLEMDYFLSQVSSYAGVNMAETIYQNSAVKGISITELFALPAASQLFVAHLVKLHEKQLIGFAEEKYQAVFDEFAAWKKQKSGVIKALGLT
jgi:hypothetical protein